MHAITYTNYAGILNSPLQWALGYSKQGRTHPRARESEGTQDWGMKVSCVES